MSEFIRKAQPTQGDAHVNKPLTNISVAYIQRTGFVADQVFPIVPVQNQSDVYYTFNRDDFWRDEAKTRAPGSESAGGGFSLTTSTYSATVEAFHKDVSDQLRANADSVLSLDTAATEFVTQKMMIRRERRFATSYFTTGVWGTDITGVASAPTGGQTLQWDAASASPRTDIDTGKLSIVQASGKIPNVLLIGYPVLLKLRSNAEVRDQYKYTSAASIDEGMLANYFGVQRLIVTSAVYTSSVEGASATTAFIGGKQALLCYSTPSPSIMEPTAGYIFGWNGLIGSQGGIRIKRFRMEHLESDRIEGQMSYDMKVVSSALGYFFTSIVS